MTNKTIINFIILFCIVLILTWAIVSYCEYKKYWPVGLAIIAGGNLMRKGSLKRENHLRLEEAYEQKIAESINDENDKFDITTFKRKTNDMLHSEYKCYKFFFKMPPNKQGPKSIRYSEYKVYQAENRSVLASWYHFFAMNECPLRNLAYYLDYGDTLIEIQNDNELINDAWRGDRGWRSPKIKTGKIHELDSTVFQDLLENSIRQTASSQLTERDIKDIADIMEKLILRLSIVNVFWLEHFLKTEYDFELSHNHKAQIANRCIASLSRVIYNNRREQATNIIAQLEKWLVK